LGTPTLALPGTEPLALGAVLVARFERSAGSRRGRGPARLTAELVCTEKATRNSLGSPDVETSEILRRALSMWLDRAEAPLSCRVRIDVPVQVGVQVEGLPDDTVIFPVTVLPVVTSRVLATEPGPR